MGMKFSQGKPEPLISADDFYDCLIAETIGFFICCTILRMCRGRIDAGWM